MRRIYTGVLLCGASISAQAGEAGEHVNASKVVQTTQIARPVPDNSALNSVLFSEKQGVVPAESLTSSSPKPSVVSEQNNNFIDELKESQKSLVNVLDALRFKRIELQGEQVKLMLRPDAAEMETENIKVALQSDSTSITWKKTF